MATYKPPSLSKEYYFSRVNKAPDAFGSNLENIIFIRDLNTTDTDERLIEFLEDREFSNSDIMMGLFDPPPRFCYAVKNIRYCCRLKRCFNHFLDPIKLSVKS